MGRYGFDIRPMPLDLTQGFAALGQALDERRERERREREAAIAERRQLASEDFTRRQSELGEARLRRQEAIDFDARAREEARRNSDLASKLPELYAKGGDTAVNAYINANRWTDHEGRQRGMRYGVEEIDRPPGDDQMAPGEAARTAEPPPPAHAETPAAGMSTFFKRGLPGSYDETATGPTEGAPEARHPLAPPPAAKAPPAKLRKPYVELEGGEKIYLNPGEGEEYKIAQRNKLADDWLGGMVPTVGNDPVKVAAARTTAEAVRSGMTGPAQASAYYLSTLQQLQGEAFKAAEGDKHDLTADQKFQIGMRPRAGASPDREKLRDEKDRMTIEGKYSAEVQKVLQNFGFRDMNTHAVKFEDLLAQVAGAKDNAALAAVAKGSFVKLAQGGTGVISDSDMVTFWHRIGGLGMRADEAWNGYANGTLSPDKQKIVSDAVNEMVGKARKNVNDMGRGIETRLKMLSGGESRIQGFLDIYTPGYARQRATGGQQGGGDAQTFTQDGVTYVHDGRGWKVKR